MVLLVRVRMGGLCEIQPITILLTIKIDEIPVFKTTPRTGSPSLSGLSVVRW